MVLEVCPICDIAGCRHIRHRTPSSLPYGHVRLPSGEVVDLTANTEALEAGVVQEMREALQGMERALQMFMDDPSRTSDMPVVIKAREALAKLEGRT